MLMMDSTHFGKNSPTLAQQVRHLVGPLVEFAIADAAAARPHRRFLRICFRALGQQLLQYVCHFSEPSPFQN